MAVGIVAHRERDDEMCRSRQSDSISFAGSARVFSTSRKEDKVLMPAFASADCGATGLSDVLV